MRKPFKDPVFGVFVLIGLLSVGHFVASNTSSVQRVPQSLPVVAPPVPVTPAPVTSTPRVWIVGKSSNAHATKFKEIVTKLKDGDVIEVERGEYRFDFEGLDKSVEIRAITYATIIMTKSVSLRVPKLSLKDFLILFSKEASLFKVDGKDMELSLENVSFSVDVVGDKKTATFEIGENARVMAKRSEFSKTDIILSKTASMRFIDGEFSHANKQIQLNDESSVTLIGSKMTFFKTAISLASPKSKFKGIGVEFSKGEQAFGSQGTGLAGKIEVSNSHFEKLHALKSKGMEFDCSGCSYIELKQVEN